MSRISYKIWKHLNKKYQYQHQQHQQQQIFHINENEYYCEKGSLKRSPVFVAGTGFSGNSATRDFLKNYLDIACFPLEFDLFRHGSGILNLYNKILAREDIYPEIDKFRNLYKSLYWNELEINKKTFSYKVLGQGYLFLCEHYLAKASLLCDLHSRNLLKTNEYVDEFVKISNLFLTNIIILWSNDEKKIPVFVHGIWNENKLDSQLEFFPDNSKIIRTYRDPRDVFVDTRRFLNEALWIPKSVEDFISWQQRSHIFLSGEFSNVLTIRFEDLCLDFNNTKTKILKFIGLPEQSVLSDTVYFNPEVSKNNIGLWKNYEDQESIKKIENALKDFCYEV